MAVVYTLVAQSGETVAEFRPEIVDDGGKKYPTKSHAFVGNAYGVLAGVLVVDAPAEPSGSTFIIQAATVGLTDGTAVAGSWTIPFLTTSHMTGPITFVQRGRLSPEEGVRINGAVVGITGPPGGTPFEVLVARDGAGATMLGLIEQNGDARSATTGDLQATTGISEFPKPPDFPWPAAVQ